MEYLFTLKEEKESSSFIELLLVFKLFPQDKNNNYYRHGYLPWMWILVSPSSPIYTWFEHPWLLPVAHDEIGPQRQPILHWW